MSEEQPPFFATPDAEINLHLGNPELDSYDHGAAVAVAALHATSSEALRTTFEEPPQTPVEVIIESSNLLLILRIGR